MVIFDFLLTKEQLKIRDEAREFVKWVPRQMILDMDADMIKFPKEFLREAARRNPLGCRYLKQWEGREMDWVTTCILMEEIRTLSFGFACDFGIGAELVCAGTKQAATGFRQKKGMGKLFVSFCSIIRNFTYYQANSIPKILKAVFPGISFHASSDATLIFNGSAVERFHRSNVTNANQRHTMDTQQGGIP